MMVGSSSFIEAFYIADERVNASKANPGLGVDFISTNDVITEGGPGKQVTTTGVGPAWAQVTSLGGN